MLKTPSKRVSVEKRLATLEAEFGTLRDQVIGLAPVKKDWRVTVGTLPDDAMTRRAFRTGARWRKGLKTP